MQHRGSARTRMVKVLLEGPRPETGVSILAGSKVVGTMGSASGTIGLALIRTDRVADALATGLSLTAGGIALRLAEPEAIKATDRRTVA